jgi:hypothetical protein
MEFRPAGVSNKTGKAYRAFWSCTRECGTTMNVKSDVQPAQAAPQATNGAAVAQHSGAPSPRLQAASTALMAAATYLGGSGASAEEVLNAARMFYHGFLKQAFMGEVQMPVMAQPVISSNEGYPVTQDADIPF